MSQGTAKASNEHINIGSLIQGEKVNETAIPRQF